MQGTEDHHDELAAIDEAFSDSIKGAFLCLMIALECPKEDSEDMEQTGNLPPGERFAASLKVAREARAVAKEMVKREG